MKNGIEKEDHWNTLNRLHEILGCRKGEDIIQYTKNLIEDYKFCQVELVNYYSSADDYLFAVEELQQEAAEHELTKAVLTNTCWRMGLLESWFNEVRSRLGLRSSESNIVAVVDKVRQLTEAKHE